MGKESKKVVQGLYKKALSKKHPIKKGQPKLANPLFYWCLGRESNSYRDKPRGILSPLRLPIPPPRHFLQHSAKSRCFIPVPFTDNQDKCQEPISFFITCRHHELGVGVGFSILILQLVFCHVQKVSPCVRANERQNTEN